jgi:alpha-ketoglutarate-dependent taurine dioxygenase
MTSRFETRRLSPQLGVEATGLDLSRLTDDDAGALVRLLDEELLVVVHDQVLPTDEQVRFMRRFGDIADELGNGTSSYYISNVRPDGTLGETPLVLHSDWTWTSVPVFVVSLYGEEVSGPAAPTRFGNAVRACASLADATRARLDGLHAVHLFHNEAQSAAVRGITRHRLDELLGRASGTPVPHVTQPVVLAHPRTGVPVLFVNALWTSHVVELPVDESEALLDELFAAIAAPENVYEHQWRQGDCVIWDNLAVQHGRPGFEGLGARRSLRRVSTSTGGASPMAAAGQGAPMAAGAALSQSTRQPGG